MLSRKALKTYFSHVHSITSYGITFWGNIPDSIKISSIQKSLKNCE